MKLKNLALSGLAIVSFNAISQTSVYVDSYFNGGRSLIFPGASIDQTDVELGMHDNISSLKVANGQCVVLFKDSEFMGPHLFFGAGEYPELSAYGFNDETSSIHVYNSHQCDSSELVYFHRHANFSSVKFAAAPNSNGDMDNYWNDNITSVTVPNGQCAVLTSNAFGGGDTRWLTSSVSTLSDYSFNDVASSWAVVNESSCPIPSTPTGGGGGGNGPGGGGLEIY